MDKAISSNMASDFIKMLVELGGIRYVDQDHIIRNKEGDDPVGVQTGIPPKRRPVAIYREGMKVGDYVVLNPFTDVLGNSPERALFTNWMCAFPGSIIKHVVERMIRVGIDKPKDVGYKATKFVAKWVENIDEKLLDEAGRIPGLEWGKIFYDRTKRIAQFQSNIGYDDLKERFKSKIRKSSWPIFVDMLKTLLQVSSNKKPESLMYESTIVSIPKIDAILHLLIDLLKRMDDPIRQFTDVEIDVPALEEHLKNLEAYREATKWFASTVTSSDDSETSDSNPTTPWATPSIGSDSSAVPAFNENSPSAEAAAIARLAPVGIIYNETFGQPGSNTMFTPYNNMGMCATIDNPTGLIGGFPAATSVAELRSW